MSAKHTPGPWEWVGTDSLWGGERKTEEILKAADDGKPYGMHSPRIEHHFDAEQAKANARLIAAAPELLEALKSLIREHDAVFAGREDGAQDSYYNAHPGRAIAYQKARAAIAKAEGRS